MMDRNKDIREKVRDFTIHEMGMANTMVTIKDEDGNEVIEKYYPPLKIIK